MALGFCVCSMSLSCGKLLGARISFIFEALQFITAPSLPMNYQAARRVTYQSAAELCWTLAQCTLSSVQRFLS